MQILEFIHRVLIKITGKDVAGDTMAEDLWNKVKEIRNNIIVSLGFEEWYYLI